MTKTIEEIYGSLVFNDKVMRETLPQPVYESLHETIQNGQALDEDVANTVAEAMKNWAIRKGCTHYTHWFQPLTGGTSEKHDAFIHPVGDGSAIMKFTGKELIKGEPDASSFPSGGLRATNEARGYTAWDPTNYAFIKDEVLCIPTVFISHNGEALDQKTPLLRSMRAISKEAARVLNALGVAADDDYVNSTIGAEQEYFLIPLKEYSARPDLIFTGRTLFGAPPAKGQELDDHYFGAVRETVSDFMKEVDTRLWELGVDAKTKHNEVAPAQHELAPVFSRATKAIDNNLLTMEMLRSCAPHHGLYCLINEKPFEGINGSGKHNNWSLSTSKMNLLSPGDDPENNLVFLITLAAVIQAVDDYQELIRATAAGPSNDHRLGADEAPPAIMSIFLGDAITKVVVSVVEGTALEKHEDVNMDLGADVLPSVNQDNTDRNRTSPFAFTGNRFEFRMPGSSANLASTNTVINAAVAKSFKEYADRLEGAKDAKAEVYAICKEVFSAHKRIIFNGDGYSVEWEKEAARRGLANNKNTPDALQAYTDEKAIKLMESLGILTKSEMLARYEVLMEHYAKKINIEALTMIDMASQMILPAVFEYSGTIARGAEAKQKLNRPISTAAEEKLLEELAQGAELISDYIDRLKKARHQASLRNDGPDQAFAYRDAVIPVMNDLRAVSDKMEQLVGYDYWPLPSYNDMLFYV
jgi:glutamine synthetase